MSACRCAESRGSPVADEAGRVPGGHRHGVTDPGAAVAEPRLPRGLIVVLAVTGLLVSVLAMREFASILGPVLLALILAMGVHPLTGILHRRGAPMWLAVTVAGKNIHAFSSLSGKTGVASIVLNDQGDPLSRYSPRTVDRRDGIPCSILAQVPIKRCRPSERSYQRNLNFCLSSLRVESKANC